MSKEAKVEVKLTEAEIQAKQAEQDEYNKLVQTKYTGCYICAGNTLQLCPSCEKRVGGVSATQEVKQMIGSILESIKLPPVKQQCPHCTQDPEATPSMRKFCVLPQIQSLQTAVVQVNQLIDRRINEWRGKHG